MTSLVIDAFDDPATLDPHKAFETGSRHPVLNMYQGLLGITAQEEVFPLLAAALPVRSEHADGVRLTIPIRGGVLFHDGSELTADDVVYSLRRAVITADGPAALLADALLGAPISELDEHNTAAMIRRISLSGNDVVLDLARPFGPLNNLLVHWSLVVSRAWCAARGEWDGDPATAADFVRRGETALDEQVNGTGPYRLGSWDREARELTFHRFTEGGHHDGPEVLVMRSVDDRMERERDLLEGRCDFSVCQPESVDRLGELDQTVLEKLPAEWSINPLGFVTQHLRPDSEYLGSGEFGPDGLPANAFSDVHMRRMLSLCFDHERYVREVLDGEGLEHTPPFPAPALPGLAAVAPVRDLAAARAEFRSAWAGEAETKGCRIVIVTHGTNISRVRAAEYLAEGLEAVSPRISVEIVEKDLPALVEILYAGRAPIVWAGWASDFLHPYAFASTLLDPRATLPTALGLRDEVLSLLVDAVRDVDGHAEQLVYQAIARHAAHQAYYVAPPGKVSYMTYNKRWQGVRLMHHMSNVLDFTSFAERTPVPAS
ncbi:ABC transporter substrate-binding protein [Lentzea sp. NPDC054927]